MQLSHPESPTHAPGAGRRFRLIRADRAAFTLMEILVVVVVIAAIAALVVSNVDQVRDQAETTVGRATMETVREAFTGSPTAPGYLADMKYLPTFSPDHLRLHRLLFEPAQDQLFNAASNRGWRGPYVRNAQGVANLNRDRQGRFPASGERRFEGDASFLDRGFFTAPGSSPYGETDELAAADPWGNPLVVQVPPDGVFAAPTPAKRMKYARLVSAGPDGYLNTPLDRLAGMLPDGTAAARGDDLVLFFERSDYYDTESP